MNVGLEGGLLLMTKFFPALVSRAVGNAEETSNIASHWSHVSTQSVLSDSQAGLDLKVVSSSFASHGSQHSLSPSVSSDWDAGRRLPAGLHSVESWC